jgi:hypothetical protein
MVGSQMVGRLNDKKSMHQLQAQAMEAATLARFFRAWRLETFTIWVTTALFRVSVPAASPAALPAPNSSSSDVADRPDTDEVCNE